MSCVPSQQLAAKFQCRGVGGHRALWGVLTSDGTSQEQASRANLPIFVGKGRLHVSIAREVDGRERNVPQKACFGTLSIGKGRKTTWNTYPIEKIKLLWNLSWNKIFPEKTELYSQVKREKKDHPNSASNKSKFPFLKIKLILLRKKGWFSLFLMVRFLYSSDF